MFGGINFGDLVQNSPICQIKISAKVSPYTVCIIVKSAKVRIQLTTWE